MRHLALLGIIVIVAGCIPAPSPDTDTPAASSVSSWKSDPQKPGCFPGSCGIAPLSNAEVKELLSPEAYRIMREADTERPYSSRLNDEHRAGTYVAADTGEPLFRSETKFDSGTGWPSFYAPIRDDVLVEETDSFLGYERTEILTRNGSHLGHVFEDGPEPTGLRYCMNGLALRFIPD